MEFKEVVGRRRSIRFFEPDKPVEREKIQVILETARLASCAVNAHWLRAIVVDRDKIPPDKLNQLKTPVAALTLDLAPVHIYFFCDLGVVKRIKGSRLRELVDAGALAPYLEANAGQPTMSRAARSEPASHCRNSGSGSGSIVSGTHSIGMANGRYGNSRT